MPHGEQPSTPQINLPTHTEGCARTVAEMHWDQDTPVTQPALLSALPKSQQQVWSCQLGISQCSILSTWKYQAEQARQPKAAKRQWSERPLSPPTPPPIRESLTGQALNLRLTSQRVINLEQLPSSPARLVGPATVLGHQIQ